MNEERDTGAQKYFNETFIKTLSRQSQIVTPAIQTGKRFAPKVLDAGALPIDILPFRFLNIKGPLIYSIIANFQVGT